jgi:hypothetical protein
MEMLLRQKGQKKGEAMTDQQVSVRDTNGQAKTPKFHSSRRT